MSSSPLPSHWEARWHPVAQQWFFIDHVRKITTWDDPRMSQPSSTPVGFELPNIASLSETVRLGSNSRLPPVLSADTVSLVARQSIQSTASSLSTASERSVTSAGETGERDLTTSATSSRFTSIANRQHNRNVSIENRRMSSSSQRRTGRSDDQHESMGPLMELSAGSATSTNTNVVVPEDRSSQLPAVMTVEDIDNRASAMATSINSSVLGGGTPKGRIAENRTSPCNSRTLAVGPNPALLSLRLVPMGPDPSLARGPDASLVRGPLKLVA